MDAIQLPEAGRTIDRRDLNLSLAREFVQSQKPNLFFPDMGDHSLRNTKALAIATAFSEPGNLLNIVTSADPIETKLGHIHKEAYKIQGEALKSNTPDSPLAATLLNQADKLERRLSEDKPFTLEDLNLLFHFPNYKTHQGLPEGEKTPFAQKYIQETIGRILQK